MVRPRWHDVLIVTAIVSLLVVGVMALWWDDVRGYLHLGPATNGKPTAGSNEALTLPRT
jgi:hypothetical protein